MNAPEHPASGRQAFLLTAGLAGAALLAVCLTGRPIFWDLASYHAAGRVWAEGGSPYLLNELRAIEGMAEVLPYFYPPWTRIVVQPLAMLPFAVVACGYALLSCSMLGLLASRLTQWASGSRWRLALVLPCGLAGSAWVALRSGNLELPLTVALLSPWLGVRGIRRAPHALSVFAAVKLQPFALIPLVYLWQRPMRLGAWFVSSGAAILLLGLPAAFDPVAASAYVEHLGTIDERGSLCPSTFNFLRSSFEEVGVPALFPWAFALAVSCIAIGGARVLYRGCGSSPQRLALLLSTFALCIPRWKDYGGVLLLPALLAVWPTGIRGWIWAIFISFPGPWLAQSCNGGVRGALSYWSWYVLVAAWILALRACVPSLGAHDAPSAVGTN